MGIATNAKLTSQAAGLKYKELFLEAVAEYKNKWRFVSLYRILEHGCLFEIFQRLSVAFFSAPKDSLKIAQDCVQSELKQFLSFVEQASLQTQFESLFDQFEAAMAGGNQFAIAVEHSIQQNDQKNQGVGRWKAGVVVCYKIRCAIVHAGLSAPIFDAYPDGSFLLEALLPSLESTALSFLGVTIL